MYVFVGLLSEYLHSQRETNLAFVCTCVVCYELVRMEPDRLIKPARRRNIGTVVEDLVKAGRTARNCNGDAIFWDSLCLGMTSSALEAEALALLAVEALATLVFLNQAWLILFINFLGVAGRIPVSLADDGACSGKMRQPRSCGIHIDYQLEAGGLEKGQFVDIYIPVRCKLLIAGSSYLINLFINKFSDFDSSKYLTAEYSCVLRFFRSSAALILIQRLTNNGVLKAQRKVWTFNAGMLFLVNNGRVT
ncbi:hypothetical protein F2Q69_00025924 [Brassica cretica]|uniref:Uncharacterized protein n=1 Tax=Brassica cretica TaxID=69181 RepID=A0A8S9SAC1_BRACR|nr:hypothetical protein F2Q69_00025924 [Brassica cretica]